MTEREKKKCKIVKEKQIEKVSEIRKKKKRKRGIRQIDLAAFTSKQMF